jgi:hypothetical protein
MTLMTVFAPRDCDDQFPWLIISYGAECYITSTRWRSQDEADEALHIAMSAICDLFTQSGAGVTSISTGEAHALDAEAESRGH